MIQTKALPYQPTTNLSKKDLKQDAARGEQGSWFRSQSGSDGVRWARFLSVRCASRSVSVFCLPAASRTRLPSLAPRSLALSLLPPPPPLYRHLLHRVDMDFSDVPPEALEDEDAFAVGGTATPCSCSVPLAPLTNRSRLCVCVCVWCLSRPTHPP